MLNAVDPTADCRQSLREEKSRLRSDAARTDPREPQRTLTPHIVNSRALRLGLIDDYGSLHCRYPGLPGFHHCVPGRPDCVASAWACVFRSLSSTTRTFIANSHTSSLHRPQTAGGLPHIASVLVSGAHLTAWPVSSCELTRTTALPTTRLNNLNPRPLSSPP